MIPERILISFQKSLNSSVWDELNFESKFITSWMDKGKETGKATSGLIWDFKNRRKRDPSYRIITRQGLGYQKL